MREIRRARKKDLPKLSCLLMELFSIEKDFIFDSLKQTRGIMMLLKRHSNSVVFISEEDGVVNGMATGQLVVSTAAGAYSVLVEDVVVSREFRNMGIGKSLLDELESWGISKGALRMQLVADKNNTLAAGFYINSGWRESSMEGFYKMIRLDK